VGARPVAVVAVHVDTREVVGAPVMMHAAIVPERASVLAGPVRTVAPPARFAEARVVMKSTPPPPPVAFAAKQRALEANGGRPLDPAAVNNLRASAPRNDRPAMRTPEAAKASGEHREEPRNERKPAKRKDTKK
jgi:hypothetical protein